MTICHSVILWETVLKAQLVYNSLVLLLGQRLRPLSLVAGNWQVHNLLRLVRWSLLSWCAWAGQGPVSEAVNGPGRFWLPVQISADRAGPTWQER
jgi:hypothetical protein